MAVSQNGYLAGDRGVIHNPVVPGTRITFPGGLRRGAAGDLLLYVAEQLHKRVEDGGDSYGMWGYAYRPIRGMFLTSADQRVLAAARIPGLDDILPIHPGNRACCFDNEDVLFAASSLSNHSSGTAFDYHAPRHPLGKSGTFNAGQVKTIRTIIHAECEGCIRWGGDYSGRKDEMHFEVIKPESECMRVLNKLRGGSFSPAPVSAPAPTGVRVLSFEPGKPVMSGDDVRALQRVLNAWYKVAKPVWWPLPEDGVFGAMTDKAVRYMQTLARLTVDGAVGPATRRALGL